MRRTASGGSGGTAGDGGSAGDSGEHADEVQPARQPSGQQPGDRHELVAFAQFHRLERHRRDLCHGKRIAGGAVVEDEPHEDDDRQDEVEHRTRGDGQGARPERRAVQGLAFFRRAHREIAAGLVTVHAVVVRALDNVLYQTVHIHPVTVILLKILRPLPIE